MNRPTCERTEILAAALTKGPLGPEASAHAARCDDCASAVALAASGALARQLAAQAHLPSARQTLLRARLEARRREAERRLRPLAIWQGVALAVAGLVALRLTPALLAGLAAAGTVEPSWASPAQALFAIGLGLLGALGFAATRRRAV